MSVRSSWPGESNDMQYDPFRSSRDLGLTWPEVKLWPWPFKGILYMVRRTATRQTRWYQMRCSTRKIKDFCIKLVLEIFWILTPGDLIFDLSQKMTEMILKWFFASFRTLPFVFLYDDQEPRSWGAFKRPPPPAGGGKSRGPAGRGLTRQRLGCSCTHHSLGGRIRPPHVLSRKRMNDERRTRRHSKDLDEKLTNHFRKWEIEATCHVKVRSKVKIGCIQVADHRGLKRSIFRPKFYICTPKDQAKVLTVIFFQI